MTLIPGTRIAADFAMFYTLVLLLPVRVGGVLMAGLLLLSALALSLAEAAGERTFLRCLCALLPPVYLLIPASKLEYGLLAPAALYAIALILTGQVWSDTWTRERHVKFSLPFELLFLVIGCSVWRDRNWELLTWGTVYFIFGIYYMHQLRLGAGVSLSGRLRDLAWVSVLPVSSALVVGAIFGGWKPIGKAVIFLVTGVGMVMQPMVEAVSHLYFRLESSPYQRDIPPIVVSETEFVETLPPETNPEILGEITIPPQLFWGMAAIAVLVILGLLLLYLFRLSRRPTLSQGESRWTEAVEGFTPAAEEPRKVSSNRRKIRKTYSNYLRLLQSRGLFRRTADTSQDILTASAPYASPAPGKKLRDIYIRARYHTDIPVSEEDVQEAAKILREIKGK